MSEYKIVYKGGTGEIVEKKSRFIANVFKVESEDEALEIIEQTRKKYWDARHNCFAYIIGENGQKDAVMTKNRRERRESLYLKLSRGRAS